MRLSIPARLLILDAMDDEADDAPYPERSLDEPADDEHLSDKPVDYREPLRHALNMVHGDVTDSQDSRSGFGSNSPQGKMFGQLLHALKPHLPSELTKPTEGTYYRGVRIRRSNLDKFLSGRGTLKPRPFQSWSSDYNTASSYAYSHSTRHVGIVIAKSIQPKHVLLNTDAAHEHLGEPGFNNELITTGSHPDLLHVRRHEVVGIHDNQADHPDKDKISFKGPDQIKIKKLRTAKWFKGFESAVTQ